MKTKSKFLVFAVSLLLVCASISASLMSASAMLMLTSHISVVSSGVYGNDLRVQYRINSSDGSGKEYAFTLFYSDTRADFEGDSVAGGVLSLELDKQETTASTDITALTGDNVYFVIEAAETNDGTVTKTYTPIYSAATALTPDTDQEYFVDCGSGALFSFDKSSDACFTANQSVTWQTYGEDAVTGKKWGVVTPADAIATALDTTLLGSTLNSGAEVMRFKFEVADASTQYNVVMGFKDQGSTRINSAADIYFNDSATIAGSYVGGFNAKILTFAGIKGAGDATDGYFIEITVAKNDLSSDLPMCSLISIRKQDAAANRFIAAGHVEISVKSGTTPAQLPATAEVYTTAGKTSLPVTYSAVTAANLTLNNSSYSEISRTASVTYGGVEYSFPITIVIWTNEDIYYFVDCQHTLPFSSSAEKFEKLKAAQSTLLNREELDRESSGSDKWGYFGARPAGYWGNVNSYVSISEGTDFNLVYNFPNLPAGNYTFEVGVTDPWGPRTTRIFVNDVFVDYITTRTAQKAQKLIRFTQTVDNAPVFIRMGGISDKPMAGWMLVAADTVTKTEPIAETPPDNTNLILIIVLPLVFVLAGTAASVIIVLKRKKA